MLLEFSQVVPLDSTDALLDLKAYVTMQFGLKSSVRIVGLVHITDFGFSAGAVDEYEL